MNDYDCVSDLLKGVVNLLIVGAPLDGLFVGGVFAWLVL